jgi:hypothetical protein
VSLRVDGYGLELLLWYTSFEVASVLRARITLEQLLHDSILLVSIHAVLVKVSKDLVELCFHFLNLSVIVSILLFFIRIVLM